MAINKGESLLLDDTKPDETIAKRARHARASVVIQDDTKIGKRAVARKDIAVIAATAVALVVCCVFADVWAAGVVALVAGLAFMLYQAFDKPAMVFKYLYFAFAVTANILGCAACEFSTSYLSEVETFAHYCGSIPLLVLSQLAFFVALLIFDSFWGAERHLSETKEASRLSVIVFRVAEVAVFCSALALFVFVARNPSFMLGYDRFQYEAAFGAKWESLLAGWLSFLVVVPAYAIRRHENKIDLVLGCVSIVLFVLYHIWVGDKFGSFFSLACVFSLVYYDAILSLSLKMLRIALLVASVAFIALLGFTYFAYSLTYDESIDTYFSERIAQQGQLWWRTYDLCGGKMHPEMLYNEVEAISNPKSEISENVGSQNGVYGIMYFTTPKKRVDAKLLSGSRFTEAGYACAYYYLGPIGVVLFALIMGFSVAAVQNAVLRSLWSKRILESAIWLRLSFHLQTIASMFTFYVLFTPLSIVCYLFLALCALARKLQKGRFGRAIEDPGKKPF